MVALPSFLMSSPIETSSLKIVQAGHPGLRQRARPLTGHELRGPTIARH
jgi:hypothetical protein